MTSGPTRLGNAFLRHAGDGYVTPEELRELRSAAAAVRGEARADAGRLVGLVDHDGELDRHEVVEARRLLRRLGIAEARRLGGVPAASVDIAHVALRLDLRVDPVDARVQMRLAKPARGRVVLEADASRLTIKSVRVNGKDVPFTHTMQRLSFDAPGTRDLAITYELRTTRRLPQGGLMRHDGELASLVWPEMIGRLMPGDSRAGPAVRATIELYAPPEMTLSASGVVVEERPGYARYEMAAAAPVYSVGVYAATGVDRTPGRRGGPNYLARPDGQPRSRGVRRAEVARHAVQMLTRWYGPSPLLPVRDVIEVPGELNGMEHTHAVHVARGATGADADNVIAHEVTHHWFGNAVRHASYADTWLTEGLTEYITVRLAEARNPTAGQRLMRSHMRNAEEALTARRATRARLPLRPAFAHVASGAVVDNYLYYYGAFVFMALERELGRRMLDTLIASWFTSHAGKAVTTDDFFAFAKARTGRDLAAFRQKWIDRLPEPSELRQATAAVREGRAPGRG